MCGCTRHAHIVTQTNLSKNGNSRFSKDYRAPRSCCWKYYTETPPKVPGTNSLLKDRTRKQGYSILQASALCHVPLLIAAPKINRKLQSFNDHIGERCTSLQVITERSLIKEMKVNACNLDHGSWLVTSLYLIIQCPIKMHAQHFPLHPCSSEITKSATWHVCTKLIDVVGCCMRFCV